MPIMQKADTHGSLAEVCEIAPHKCVPTSNQRANVAAMHGSEIGAVHGHAGERFGCPVLGVNQAQGVSSLAQNPRCLAHRFDAGLACWMMRQT